MTYGCVTYGCVTYGCVTYGCVTYGCVTYGCVTYGCVHRDQACYATGAVLLCRKGYVCNNPQAYQYCMNLADARCIVSGFCGTADCTHKSVILKQRLRKTSPRSASLQGRLQGRHCVSSECAMQCSNGMQCSWASCQGLHTVCVVQEQTLAIGYAYHAAGVMKKT